VLFIITVDFLWLLVLFLLKIRSSHDSLQIGRYADSPSPVFGHESLCSLTWYYVSLLVLLDKGLLIE